MDQTWNVIVVGAGAAGLLAAIAAAERGKRTLLLEKNRRPGVKILMSGGTRCNITHATDNRGIVEAFGPAGRFLHSALAALSVEQTIELFEAEGVATKVEETGKVFPVSNKAADVLDALLRRLHRSGATSTLGEPAADIRLDAVGFTIVTPLRSLTTSKLILTTGGRSYPGSGTTGDGYGFAALWGHSIIPPRPALVPIRVAAPWIAALRGVTIPDVALAIREGDRTLATRRGSLLFAHFGLTGPVALDVSRTISGHAAPQTLQLLIDFTPNMAGAEWDRYLQQESLSSAKQQLSTIIANYLPHRLAESLLTQLGFAIDRRAAALTRADRGRLVLTIKQLILPVLGTLGFEKAEVTAGGISLDEVDSRTMASKLVPNLYLAGEVLDLDGPIGGYNFQAAFSTGWLAGSRV